MVYEGRRFLRPETGPKVEGAKEAGFENLPRMIIACVLTAAFMIGGGIWYSNKLRSGEIKWDSPMKWLVLVFTLGPLVAVIGSAALSLRRRKSSGEPELPPNTVRLSWGFEPNRPSSGMLARLEIENGLIRVHHEGQTVEINRSEIDQIKIVDGKVRLRVPSFHALPSMYLFLKPLSLDIGKSSARREAVDTLAAQIDNMLGSTLPSTCPAIEMTERERPRGTWAKCSLAGLAIWGALEAFFKAGGRSDPPGASLFAASILTIFIVILTFGDVWLAKSNNNSLRRKGIVRE